MFIYYVLPVSTEKQPGKARDSQPQQRLNFKAQFE